MYIIYIFPCAQAPETMSRINSFSSHRLVSSHGSTADSEENSLKSFLNIFLKNFLFEKGSILKCRSEIRFLRCLFTELKHKSMQKMCFHVSVTSEFKGLSSKLKINRYRIYHLDIIIFHIVNKNIKKQTTLLVFSFQWKL